VTTPCACWCGGRGCASVTAAGTGSGVAGGHQCTSAMTAGTGSSVAVPVPRALLRAGVDGVAGGRADQIQILLTELPF